MTGESELVATPPRSVSDNASIKDLSSRYPAVSARIGHYLRTYAKRLAWAAVTVATGLSLYLYVSAPASVQVVTINTVEATETLGATGKVRGEKVADLGLDTFGVVRGISVREGDAATAGQLLLSLDTTQLDAEAAAARAAVASAEAELRRASRPALRSEIDGAKAELARSDSVGRARIDQAEARLADVQSGARPQEIAAAQAELQSRKAVLKKAEKDLKRTQLLVKEGALAAARLDQATTDVETARAAVTAQQESVNLLKAGGRPGQIAEAKAAVVEARASRDTSVRAARERLNALLAIPRPEDVAAARARVNEARAKSSRTLALRAKSEIRAPFDGVVADLLVEQGQSVSPGQKLVTFQQIGKPIIEVETDEDNLGVLSPGMKAVVSSGAYKGRTFEAILYDLGSEVDSERGTIQIKLRPTGSVEWLRPDMTADVNIITKTAAKRVIVPPDAVTRVGDSSAVLVVSNGETVSVPVTTGAVGPEGVVVFGKLKDGDQVVRHASKVGPGEPVRITGGQ